MTCTLVGQSLIVEWSLYCSKNCLRAAGELQLGTQDQESRELDLSGVPNVDHDLGQVFCKSRDTLPHL